MIPPILTDQRQAITDFARRNHISYMALFGSYARGEQKPGSDLDLLVDFSKEKGLFDFVDIQQKLSDLLGVKVNMVSRDGLSRHIKPYIQDDLQVIYAEKS